MQPKISIIIPIYNVEKYVRECLESVINQTIDHSLVECIVVNDCTPDNSIKIVNGVVDEYRNGGGQMSITILNHDVNRGLSASRNTGMRHANGEFVFFIDSDDYLFPDALKTLMDYHLSMPEVDLIIGNNHNEYLMTKCYDIDKARTIVNMNYLFMGNCKKLQTWNNLIRRSLLTENGIEFVDGILFEDNVFNYQLYPLVKTAIIIPEVTYFYRKNPNGIILATRKEKVEKSVRDYLLIFKFFIEHLQGSLYVGKSIATIDLAIKGFDFFKNNIQRIEQPDIAKNQYYSLCRQLLSKHLKKRKGVLARVVVDVGVSFQ
ncbi:MAG: glycosyltransferase family 2 protein [Prevotella sp.]